jgi:hypothetical protein
MLQAAIVNLMRTTMGKEEKEEEQQSQARKPFRNPRLQIYGHISAITQASMGAIMDNIGKKTGA